MTPTLDFDAVLHRLAARGLANSAFPAVQEALSLLEAEASGLSTDTELGDLLIRLTRMDRLDVATELLVEGGRWFGAAEAHVDHLARAWWQGRDPDSEGYGPARSAAIAAALVQPGAVGYGAGCGGLDERVVEYPWLFHSVAESHPRGGRILDAGSILNHAEVLSPWLAADFGPLSIVTLEPEATAFPSPKVRYEYADIRALPYRDHLFDTVLCMSTLEHVGMDNSIYGAEGGAASDPAGEADRALGELWRVLAPGGTLLLSVPYGAPVRHRWWRIFGPAEIERIHETLPAARSSVRYFRAFEKSWEEVDAEAAGDAGYNERHPGGRRDAPPWVAAAEAVALIRLGRPGVDGTP